jgi:hypothetical protein
MLTEDTDNSGAYFSFLFVDSLLMVGGFLVRGHAKVCAENINADLLLDPTSTTDPLIGEFRHGVHARETDSSPIVPYLFSRRGVSLAKISALSKLVTLTFEIVLSFSRALPAVGDQRGAASPYEGYSGDVTAHDVVLLRRGELRPGVPP